MDVESSIIQAGLKRIGPCRITIATTVFGIMPNYRATDRVSDAMPQVTIPSVGGMDVSPITLLIVTCVPSAVEE